MKSRVPWILLTFAIFLTTGTLLFAQDEAEKTGKEKSEERQRKSIGEERRDTLRYGITPQILSVLETISEEEDPAYTDEVESLLDTVRDTRVHTAVFRYFAAIENDSLAERAAEVLENHLDKPARLVSSVISYAAEAEIEELEPPILVIAESSISGTLSLDAIKTLGVIGNDRTVERLLELYNDSDVAEQVREQIILVLGKLGAEDAVDLLIEIAEDEGETVTLRRFAADSLGRIGSELAVDTLKELYLHQDPYLRANAVYSLGLIGGPEAEEILFAALRDEFWRIRVSAAEAIGEGGIQDGFDILIYKAQNDPEVQVRTAAVEALGRIGGGKAFDFLRELAREPKNPVAVRTKALETIVAEDLSGSTAFVKELFAEESTKRSSVILDPLGRILSEAEGSGLASIYEMMLGSPSIPMKIYALRGIRVNKIGSLRDQVEKLTGEDSPASVRRYAEGVLESF
jgi:HEAT repeat protein